MQTKTIKKGTILETIGSNSGRAYYVKKGLLRSYWLGENGKEHIFLFAPEDWYISASMHGKSASSLVIDAIEDTEIEIHQNIKPNDVEDNLKKLYRRVDVLQKRVMMLMSAPAIERYEHFLETYPNIVQRVPQRMIASYLGITPQALSTVKKLKYLDR